MINEGTKGVAVYAMEARIDPSCGQTTKFTGAIHIMIFSGIIGILVYCNITLYKQYEIPVRLRVPIHLDYILIGRYIQ